MLPVSFMNEEATNDLSSIGYVFCSKQVESQSSSLCYLHFTGTY